jgi:hypothetical protein
MVVFANYDKSDFLFLALETALYSDAMPGVLNFLCGTVIYHKPTL